MKSLDIKRTELKFLITYEEYYKLRNQLSILMTLDTHANALTKDYFISSVYFDDLYQSRVGEKADGIEYHQKFRLRSYSRDDVRLEYKTKIGQLTGKESLWVTQDLSNAIIERDFDILYQHIDNPLIADIVTRMKLDDLHPEVVIDYQREAYTYPEGDVRVTFDKNIVAYRFGNEPGFSRKVHEPGLLILELKYTEYLPDTIRKVIFSHKFQVCSLSKYYMGWLVLFN